MSICLPRLNIFLKGKIFRARRLIFTKAVQINFHSVYKQTINEGPSLEQKSRKQRAYEMISSVLISFNNVSCPLSEWVLTLTVVTPRKKTWSQNLLYLCQQLLSFELILSERSIVLSLGYLERASAGFLRSPLTQSIIDDKRVRCSLRPKLLKLQKSKLDLPVQAASDL